MCQFVRLLILGLCCLSTSFRAEGQNSAYCLPLHNHVPAAFGTGYLGTVSLGGTLQSRSRLSGDFVNPDGNAMVSVGLGNPTRWVGLQAGLNIYGLSNERGAPDNLLEGSLDLHLNRRIADTWWLAGGALDLFGWQLAPAHRFTSSYVALTKVINLSASEDSDHSFAKSAYLTIGTGNGRFRSDGTYDLTRSGPFGLLFATTLALSTRCHVFAEWSGYSTTAGCYLSPLRQFPLVLMAGIDDVPNKKWKFIAGAAWGFRLGRAAGQDQSAPGWFLPGIPAPQTSRI
ncbi:MAG: hypothetical protein RLY31_385 [Bacteroidota bacterium]|jgi:hypothetical protein